jgi:nucleoside-diphosphate-sugar epimerase
MRSAFYVVYFNIYLTGFWQALLHEKIIVPGDGLALRTMTFVDDTVSALIELMNSKHEKVVSGPVNIGSVKPASLLVSSSVPDVAVLEIAYAIAAYIY